MDDRSLVEVVERCRHFCKKSTGFGRSLTVSRPSDVFGKNLDGLAADEFHAQVRIALMNPELVHAHNVGVIQSCQGPVLPRKPRSCEASMDQELYGDRFPSLGSSALDRRHSALGNRPRYSIGPDRSGDGASVITIYSLWRLQEADLQQSESLKPPASPGGVRSQQVKIPAAIQAHTERPSITGRLPRRAEMRPQTMA